MIKFPSDTFLIEYPPRTKTLSESLQRIDQYLLNYKEYDRFLKDLFIARCAKDQFNVQEDCIQIQMKQIEGRLLKLNNEELCENKELHTNYKKMIQIFAGLNQIGMKIPPEPLPQEPDPIDSTYAIVNHSEMDEIRKKFLNIQKDKFYQMSKFYQDFAKHYLPAFGSMQEDVTFDLFQEELIKNIPELVKNAFINTPRNLYELEKKLILKVVEHLGLFFSDFYKALKLIKEPDIKKDEKELINIMNRNLKLEGKRTIIPDNLDKNKALENIYRLNHELNESIFSYTKWESPFQKIILSGMTYSSVKIIDQLFHPKVWAGLTLQLLENKIDLNKAKSQSHPLNMYDSSDTNFNETFGILVKKIINVFIKIGQPEFPFNMVTSRLKNYIKKKRNNIGPYLQKKLNCFLSSNILFYLPTIILDQLFFSHDRQPILLPYFNGETIEPKTLHEKISQKLYNIILQQAKKYGSEFGKKVVKKFDSIKTFSENQANLIFRFTQQEMLLKLLYSYIAEGMISAFRDLTNEELVCDEKKILATKPLPLEGEV